MGLIGIAAGFVLGFYTGTAYEKHKKKKEDKKAKQAQE